MSSYNNEKNERYLAWYEQGQFDLQAAKISMEAGFNEWATFQSVQSVEKALKAIIVYAGMNPPKIHKLQTLIGISNRVCPEFKRTKFQFRYLESFTFISRYPFLLPGKNETPHELISRVDAERAIEQAEQLIQKIGFILSHETEEVQTEPELRKYSSETIETRLKEVTDMLVTEFAPQKIYLFGRFAREKEVEELSTMDILVIADTELRFIDRISRAREVTKGGLPIIEPLVYTPEEFKIMTEDVREGFLENALNEGRVVYESPSQ